jgi:hypothetical protein
MNNWRISSDGKYTYYEYPDKKTYFIFGTRTKSLEDYLIEYFLHFEGTTKDFIEYYIISKKSLIGDDISNWLNEAILSSSHYDGNSIICVNSCIEEDFRGSLDEELKNTIGITDINLLEFNRL